MDKPIFYNKIYIFLCINLLLISCRTNDTEETLNSVKSRTLKINVLGSYFNEKETSSRNIALNGIISNKIEIINPSYYVTTEVKEDINSFRPISNSNAKSKSIIDGGNLSAGTMFRVSVYDNSGNYVKSKDYTIGEKGDDIYLEDGSYTIVAYSFGATTLPVISDSEKGNLFTNTAIIDYNNTNRDFMYEKQNITVSKEDPTTISLNFAHKLSLVTVNIDFSDAINAIPVLGVTPNGPDAGWGNIVNNVTNATIGDHYVTSKFNLNSGNMFDYNSSTSENLNFPSTEFGKGLVRSLPIFINSNNNKENSKFTSTVETNLNTNSFSRNRTFSIIPGRKLNITFKARGCGAYLGPDATEWRNFTCHNLGADTTADPFTPSDRLSGARYQWGSNGSELTHRSTWMDQTTNQSTGTLPSGTWNNIIPEPNSWTGDNNNPCPDGYRIPTKQEMELVIQHNNRYFVGAWFNNTSSGTFIGKGLFMPVTGFRSGPFATRYNINLEGLYWTSDPSGNQAYAVFLNNPTKDIRLRSMTDGLAIRCIQK